jgi:methylated-DNA-protein-cysteine methyltransferase-like protein
MPTSTSLYRDIYAAVARIPHGRVATYGQVARLAGIPGKARLVGYALSVLTDPTIPWHRVINARGEVSPRTGGDPADELQRLRLESEGVEFDAHGRISLARFQWRAA